MRKAIRTSILILALSGSTYAGDIPNNVPVPPPPAVPATSGLMAEPTVSEPTEVGATEATLIEIGLNLLQSALTIF